MPAFGNITLNSKVYGPDSNTAGTAVWKNRESGFVNGFKVATAKLTSGSTSNKSVSRVRLSLKLPVVASETSTCVCEGDLLHTNQFVGEFILHNASSTAERTALRLAVIDQLALAITTAMVDNFEPVYGV